MTEQPDLQYYKICISRNGGPVAFLLKDHTVLFNNKDDTKNIIFIFTAYGKLLTVVNVSTFFSPLPSTAQPKNREPKHQPKVGILQLHG